MMIETATTTPSTRPMVAIGKLAWCALMSSETRTGSRRSRVRTRLRLQRECHAPPAAACSRAAAGPTRRWPDAPHRVLRKSTVRAREAAGRPPPSHRPGEGEIVLRSAIRGEVLRYETVVAPDSLGSIEASSLSAGQGVGLMSRLQPAGEIVRTSLPGLMPPSVA